MNINSKNSKSNNDNEVLTLNEYLVKAKIEYDEIKHCREQIEKHNKIIKEKEEKLERLREETRQKLQKIMGNPNLIPLAVPGHFNSKVYREDGKLFALRVSGDSPSVLEFHLIHYFGEEI